MIDVVQSGEHGVLDIACKRACRRTKRLNFLVHTSI